MIRLGEALREHGVNMQTQYASRYLTGMSEFQFGNDLRVDLTGYENGGDYHAILIHKDDAPIFCKRVNDHRAKLGL